MNCRAEILIVAAGLLLAFDVYLYRCEEPRIDVLNKDIQAMKATRRPVFVRVLKDGKEMDVDMLSERTLDLWEKKIEFLLSGVSTLLTLGFVAYLLMKAEIKRRYLRDDTLNSIDAMLGLHKREWGKHNELYQFSILHLLALMVATACVSAACVIQIR